MVRTTNFFWRLPRRTYGEWLRGCIRSQQKPQTWRSELAKKDTHIGKNQCRERPIRFRLTTRKSPCPTVAFFNTIHGMLPVLAKNERPRNGAVRRNVENGGEALHVTHAARFHRPSCNATRLILPSWRCAAFRKWPRIVCELEHQEAMVHAG